jgi:hypothetical protein
MQRINRLNTLFFGSDLEYLLLVKERVLDTLDKKTTEYSYTYSIEVNDNGWYLNVNIYHNAQGDAAEDI